MARVLIAAGGTGGHVYPALATATVLRERGYEVEFAGGDRIETRLIPEAGYPLHVLPVRSLPRGPSLGAVRAGIAFVRSVSGARRLLRRLGTEVVLGMGSYPSAAPAWAAGRLGLPVVLHEQNARLSLGNRIALRRASVLALSLPLADPQPPRVRVEMTGNPLRARLREVAFDDEARRQARDRALAAWSLDPRLLTVLAFGGSLGALPLNEAVPTAAAGWRGHGVQVLHIAGPEHASRTREACSGSGVPSTVVGYVDAMEEAYAAADLVVSRAGASTVAELLAFGLPSVLVPLPHAPRGAQEANARALERAGAAVVVVQRGAWGGGLSGEVVRLLEDVERRRAMGSAARALGVRDAAERLADAVGSISA